MSPTQKPRLATLPALMFAAGLGMAMYYGELWWHLPSYSATEVEQSVELNLALDLQRREAAGGGKPADLDGLRASIRTELLQSIADEARQPKLLAATGLAMMLIGLAQMILLRRWAAR